MVCADVGLLPLKEHQGASGARSCALVHNVEEQGVSCPCPWDKWPYDESSLQYFSCRHKARPLSMGAGSGSCLGSACYKLQPFTALLLYYVCSMDQTPCWWALCFPDISGPSGNYPRKLVNWDLREIKSHSVVPTNHVKLLHSLMSLRSPSLWLISLLSPNPGVALQGQCLASGQKGIWQEVK